MKTFRTTVGPFRKRPYYGKEELERLCDQELRTVDLYPAQPEPVRIERFIEKRFAVVPKYDDLPDHVLGVTKFGARGVEEVVVSRRLANEGRRAADRRISTTLAHEAGHGLLHRHLFGRDGTEHPLFENDPDVAGPQILCRDEAILAEWDKVPRAYGGKWWEYQANQAMAALLLPRDLVKRALEPLLVARGMLGCLTLPPDRQEDAARLLADVFDVNPVVGRIRLGDLFPAGDAAQLTL